jgi:protein TonB
MPATPVPTGPLALSIAIHAAALGAVALFCGAPPEEPVRGPLAVALVVLPPMEEDPAPPAPLPPEPRLPEDEVALVEDPPDAVDPRLVVDDAGSVGTEAFPAAPPGTLGLGGGGPPRRRARPAAPARAAAEPVPEAPAPAPPEPLVRARPRAGACAGPDYPARERRLGVEGLVEVRVEVSAEGGVDAAAIDRSSGSAALDAAALEAVRRWTFVPARRGEEAVPDVVLVPVRFVLVAARSVRDRE